jgi:iron(III) transport system ATP-binding protein
MYLVIDNVVKVFPARGGAKEVRALDGITIEINKGELVTLLGLPVAVRRPRSVWSRV